MLIKKIQTNDFEDFFRFIRKVKCNFQNSLSRTKHFIRNKFSKINKIIMQWPMNNHYNL